jgi:hypothetical protein
MRPFYFLGGLLLLFICFATLRRKFQEYQVQQNGELVEVRITKLKPSIGCKVLHFFDFEFAGNLYSKKAGCNFHDSHKPGQVIKLKHLPDIDIFLFPDEDIGREFIAFWLLGIFGLFLLVKAATKPT